MIEIYFNNLGENFYPLTEDLKIPLIADDPWLEPYEKDIRQRQDAYLLAKSEIEKAAGSIKDFSNAYKYYGINFDRNRNGWYYREWAPEAFALYLIGDFNNWDRTSHQLFRNDKGDWEIFLPYDEYKNTFVHESRIKVHVHARNGQLDRIPAYITRVIQDPETHDFNGQLWLSQEFNWSDHEFSITQAHAEPLIYECHIGLAQEKEGIGTYAEFTTEILPRIKALGYNAIQVMAIQEHPYYGSFGYHVSNFYAASSRFGTPEELKHMIDTAHQLGLTVIMDVVHSHAVKNIAEGLNEFDGTDYQYFHSGPKGYHEAWDSKLFDYGKWKVKEFLLSNLKFWMDEYHFDGFRFDGVTSLLYLNHGHCAFDHYDKYFRENVDKDAVIYLQLANDLVHELKNNAISIAEDVSGMPGLCRLNSEGGLGFDFRLGMGIPDYWIKLLKEKSDEEWNIHELWSVLSNRRYKERTIAYCESHDQALVGDKTLAFWLMDKEMYYHMMKDDKNLIIERGIALHKMIRLITISLGGEGYLNFIGNEFGHPEWIDFPRQGNNWSHQFARRQWTLVDSKNLKYQYLWAFDRDMIHTIAQNNVLSSLPAKDLNMDTENNIMVFERNNLVFVFNFNVSRSIFGYKFWVPQKGSYSIILNTDAAEYGGFERIDTSILYDTDKEQFIHLYLTNRTAIVLKKVK